MILDFFFFFFVIKTNERFLYGMNEISYSSSFNFEYNMPFLYCNHTYDASSQFSASLFSDDWCYIESKLNNTNDKYTFDCLVTSSFPLNPCMLNYEETIIIKDVRIPDQYFDDSLENIKIYVESDCVGLGSPI